MLPVLGSVETFLESIRRPGDWVCLESPLFSKGLMSGGVGSPTVGIPGSGPAGCTWVCNSSLATQQPERNSSQYPEGPKALMSYTYTYIYI